MGKGLKNVYLVLFLVFNKKQMLKSITSKLQFNPRDSSTVMKEEKGKARVSARRRKTGKCSAAVVRLESLKSQGIIKERQKLKYHVLVTKSVMP